MKGGRPADRQPPTGGMPSRGSGAEQPSVDDAKVPAAPDPWTRRRDAADDGARPDARELAALEESVQVVGRRGRGAVVATGLITLAFVVGLVRPWDWLAGTQAREATAPSSPSGAAAAAGSPGATTEGGPSPTPAPGSDAAAAQVCDYPQSWRSATMQDWAGRRARVWTAIQAVTATGPLDPSIDFQVIAGDHFTAIGWCAPVLGPDRPPLSATGRLFRVTSGKAVEPRSVLLEPAAPNALGELLAPAPGSNGVNGTWEPGRYVIEMATPERSWVRFIGLELRTVPVIIPSSAPVSSAPVSSAPATQPSPAPSG